MGLTHLHRHVAGRHLKQLIKRDRQVAGDEKVDQSQSVTSQAKRVGRTGWLLAHSEEADQAIQSVGKTEDLAREAFRLSATGGLG